MSINYTSKQNARPLGQELLITGEMHTVGIIGVDTILANTVKLIEVPRQDLPISSISIPTYTETTSSIPGPGQFYVDYVNGYITFNASANGNIVSVTYYGKGSEIDSIDINELQGPVGVALTIAGAVTPVPLASDPALPQVGQIYFNTTTKNWTGWDGTGWRILG